VVTFKMLLAMDGTLTATKDKIAGMEAGMLKGK